MKETFDKVKKKVMYRVTGEADGTVETRAVVRILQRCHEAESETDAVGGVCHTVRAALGAGAVSAFALVDGTMQLAASAGQRACGPGLAERSAALLLIVGPEESALGRELAAPVRYGGAAVGSLAVRWSPGAPGAAESRARGVLAAAAAAIGPAMAALGSSAPATHAAESSLGDLGGPSAAIADVRLQVRRAAAAPYPVLVLGESGTGKELIAKAIHAGSAEGCADSAPSTAPRSATTSSKRNCSDMRAGLSPARHPTAPACSRRRMAARCFSTRSASSRRARKPSCCARYRKGKSGASARTTRGGSIPASWRPRTGRSATRSRPGDSVTTCCTGSTSCASRCRRCANAPRTWVRSPESSGARRCAAREGRRN